MPDAIYPDSVAGPARGDNCKKRAKKNSGNLWQNHAASAVMALRTGLTAEAFILFLFLPSSLCFPVNPSPLQPLYRGKSNSGLCASCQGKEPTMGEEVILFPIFFTLIGFVIWTIFSTIRRSKTERLQAELQTKLLEKFGSGQELLAYVQSDAGKRFLESLTMEQRTPYGRILGAAQVSVILVLLSLAFLFLRGRIAGADEGFLVFGTITLSLGLGFGLSAALSYYLSKSFGLLTESTAHRR